MPPTLDLPVVTGHGMDTEMVSVHVENDAAIAVAVRELAMGINGQLLYDVGVAALLHDIGKLAIPEEILTKTGALTAEDRCIINEHPVRGAHYLLDVPGVPRLAVVSCYEHHMNFDGSGYPEGADGRQQNLCSQMPAAADYFDALRTKRSYRGALDHVADHRRRRL